MSLIEPWRRIESREMLRAKTFLVRRDHVSLPGGSDEPIEYTYLEQPNSVVVVPLRDDDQVLMVEQYRYPVGRVTWEFPAGSLAEGETPQAAACRELAEEIGGEAADLRPIGSFCQAASLTSAELFVLLARGLRPGEPQREVTEQMAVHAVPLADVERLIEDGTIHTAVAITSYYLARRWLQRNES